MKGDNSLNRLVVRAPLVLSIIGFVASMLGFTPVRDAVHFHAYLAVLALIIAISFSLHLLPWVCFGYKRVSLAGGLMWLGVFGIYLWRWY